MKNKGLHTHRLKNNPEEKRFAKAWEKDNELHGTLSYLLGEGVRVAEVSDRDRQVAATVIQWLGSPVGQYWLEGVKSR